MKILIVKLGATGDVLRTTPLLKAYKELYKDCHITWIVEPLSAPVLEDNPHIDRIIPAGAPHDLKHQRFDLAINLDKEREALDLIDQARAGRKQGFGWNPDRSGVTALNPASEYAVRLGVDDELKFRLNKKTYQQICFEQAEIPFKPGPYEFYLRDEERHYARSYLTELGVLHGKGRKLIGINTGSGEKFAGKKLNPSQIIELAKFLTERRDCAVILLGGARERELNAEIEKKAAGTALNAGTHHSMRQFAGIVSQCAAVVTGDTFCMHIAIAIPVPVLAYFGSTSAPEIELYGRGKKVVSSVDCSPCYKRICPIHEICLSQMKAEDLFKELCLLF